MERDLFISVYLFVYSTAYVFLYFIVYLFIYSFISFPLQWFGEVDSEHHISNSRWAHSKMPKQKDLNHGVKNSYGYIRSYWNNNPDPGVSDCPCTIDFIFYCFIFLLCF